MMQRPLKIYFDGACDNRSALKIMGLGIHANDGDKVIWEQWENRGSGTSNIAEWMACVEAFKMAVELTKDGSIYNKVEIYSDSQLIVRQFLGEYEIKREEFRPYFREALKLRIVLDKAFINIKWIRRQYNETADVLSKKGLALPILSAGSMCYLEL